MKSPAYLLHPDHSSVIINKLISDGPLLFFCMNIQANGGTNDEFNPSR